MVVKRCRRDVNDFCLFIRGLNPKVETPKTVFNKSAGYFEGLDLDKDIYTEA